MFPLETFYVSARDLAEPIRVSARDLRRFAARLLCVFARDLRRIAARLLRLLMSFIGAMDRHVFSFRLAVGVLSDDLNR